MKITNILQEAAGPKVGRKYQHIEDLVLSNGSVGGLHAVERLKHMADQGGSIELKWDGMPVVYWGRDEKGNFSMIPKNAWAYLKSGKTQTATGAPTVMNSPEDIKAFVLGTGGGDPKARQAFANQFASLWPYFEKISPKQGYLEGGLLFYPGTKPDGTTAMPVLNKETNTYDFTPNITTFHIPVDSDLGKQIANSKVMVAATGYYPAMGSSDEQRYPDAQQLSVPGVIVQGTTYVQDPVQMDLQGLANLEAFIKKNAKLIDNYLAPKPGLSNPGGELYAYANKHLRTEGLLRDFPEWAKANMSEKKAQIMLSDTKGLQATLGAVEGITNQKNVLIGQLSQGLHGGIKQTKPEGYAQAHPGAKFKYDIPGQFIKAIDQTNWKPRESVMEKAKQQASKPIVVGWGRGMGHTGHDALVSAVIHAAQQQNATPAFFVSRSFGKDDPIPPDTKVAMYKKKFPKYAPIFRLPSPEKPTINDVLADMATKGFTDATLVVGADQKDAFGYLTRPDKSGVPPYKKFGFNSFNVISRQETGDPLSDPNSPSYHEGPRATPMREVLMDPSKSEQEQFQVWRQSMSPSLSDEEVLQMMRTAKENLVKFNMPKPKIKKASELKEFIERIKQILPEADQQQKEQIYKMLSEAKFKLNEFAPGGNFKPPAPPKEKGNDPWGDDDRSKIGQAVKQLLAAGNKVDWKVPGQMGHVVRVNDDGVTMKRWGVKRATTHYFLPLSDDRDDRYQILMKAPGHYEVVSSGLGEGINAVESADNISELSQKPKDAALTVATNRLAMARLDNNELLKKKYEKMTAALAKGGAKVQPQKAVEYFDEGRVLEDAETANIGDAVIDFYTREVSKMGKGPVDDYSHKAKELFTKADPSIKEKLLDIFKAGKQNPYLQGGIITTVGSLLAGGVLAAGQKFHLTPGQTNIMLQAILNTVIPTMVSRVNGKNWVDTLKYTLASAGIGTGIAAITEEDYLEEK